MALDRVLFLDFDGVLHPSLAAPSQYFMHLPALVAVLDEASCEIVISSSWRFEHSLEGLRRRFPARLRKRVTQTTGEGLACRHARYREILECLAFRADVPDWRALDDSRFEFPETCEHLILCPAAKGLGRPQLESLHRWLHLAEQAGG